MKTPLWLFWQDKDGSNRPPYINLCKQTFIKHCSSDFDVNVLNFSSPLIPEMPKRWYSLSKICQKVDILRVFLVEKYGGLWFDIDTIMIKSPLKIMEPILNDVCEFTYFKFSKISPGVPLNGFFGGKKNCNILKRWKSEIEHRLLKNSSYPHTEFGEQSLSSVVKNHTERIEALPLNWVYQLEDKDNFFITGQGMHYELLRKNLSIEDVVKDHTIGVSLYNDMYHESNIVRREFNVVNMTEKQFLDSDVLSAKIIKMSLAI